MIEYGYACFKSYDIFNSHIFSKGPYPKNKFEKKTSVYQILSVVF